MFSSYTNGSIFCSSTWGKRVVLCCFWTLCENSLFLPLYKAREIRAVMVNNWTSLFPSKYRRTSGLPSPTNSSLHSKYFHLCIKMTFLLCSFTDFPRWHPRSIILTHRTKPSNYPSCIIHWPINRSWPTHDLIWQTLGSTCGNLCHGRGTGQGQDLLGHLGWPRGRRTKERSHPAARTLGSPGSQPCLCLLSLAAGESVKERFLGAVILHSHTAMS